MTDNTNSYDTNMTKVASTTATSSVSNHNNDNDTATTSNSLTTNSTVVPRTVLSTTATSSSSLNIVTNQLLEWPADPNMYQLVGKIGQGAFATVWKAYRLIPTPTVPLATTSSTTLPYESSADSTTTTAQTTTQNEVVENSTTTQVEAQSSSSSNTATSNMVTCAVKVLNLDHADSANLAEIRLEVQAMRLLSHPNVLPCYTAFVNERNLWLITPLMAKGSSLHSLQSIRKLVRRQRRQQQQQVVQSSYDENLSNTIPSGIAMTSTATMTIQMEQHIMYILHETIVGLQYIHENLQIHRDIKAGNILIDTNGSIKIADFGVSSFLLLQNGSLYQHEKAKTFVGTPCWMAPEVMEQMNGYDYKADIWSLGITALELAKGYAPYAKYPPMKVLILTIQEEPPSLASYDIETGFTSTDEEYDDVTGSNSSNNLTINETYSSDFEDFVRLCLQKDPSQRPTCTELLASHHFADYPETRQRRMDAMRDEICALVKDVGYKQEERASAASMATRQPPPTVVATTYGSNGMEDATVMAGNLPKSVLIQQRVAEVEDRPAGTTWIFATEESLSDPPLTGTSTAHPDMNGCGGNSSGSSSNNMAHITFQEGEGDMSVQRTVRRRGSGQHLHLDGDEYDDVLAELDEFERQTGGEHYDRQRQQLLQQNDDDEEEEAPPVILDTSVTVPIESTTNGQETQHDNTGTKMVGTTTEDDLDQFMDEFEQNTGGEDFRRTS